MICFTTSVTTNSSKPTLAILPPCLQQQFRFASAAIQKWLPHAVLKRMKHQKIGSLPQNPQGCHQPRGSLLENPRAKWRFIIRRAKCSSYGYKWGVVGGKIVQVNEELHGTSIDFERSPHFHPRTLQTNGGRSPRAAKFSHDSRADMKRQRS